MITITHRIPLDLDVLRDRNVLFRKIDSNTIENVYILKIINTDNSAHRYRVTASGLANIQTVPAETTVEVPWREVYNLSLRVCATLARISCMSNEVEFKFANLDNETHSVIEKMRFLAPL